MAVDYPSQFRLAIQQGKKREVAKTFINSEPLTGKMYTQRLTDEAPVIWDFDLVFMQFQAKLFDAWFKVVADSGNESVNMPIKTEQGIVVHEVRFIDIPQPREVGETWRYSCSVQAAKIERPDNLNDLINIINLGYVEQNLYDIDGAVNMYWPNVYFMRRNSGDGNYVSIPTVTLSSNYSIELDVYPEAGAFHLLSDVPESFRIYYEPGFLRIQSYSSFSRFECTIPLNKMSRVRISRVDGVVNAYINDIQATPNPLNNADLEDVVISRIAGKFGTTSVPELTGIIKSVVITDSGSIIRNYPMMGFDGTGNVVDIQSGLDGTIIGEASGDKGEFKQLENGNWQGVNLQTPPWSSPDQIIEVL